MRVSQLAPHRLCLALAFLVIGTAWPAFGQAALAGLPAWSFANVLFGMLSMSAGPIKCAELAAALATVSAVTVLSPLLASGMASLLNASLTLHGLMVIAACSPVTPSIGALAAILHLPDKAVVVAAITTACTAPLVLPLANHVLAHDALAISTRTLAVRTAMFVMVPVVLAFLARWNAPAHCAAWQADFSGMTVLALSMLAAARGPGLRYGLATPMLVIELALLACAVAALTMLAGWAVSLMFERRKRLSIIFAAGMRNVPAVWASLGNTLDPAGALFMTLSIVPFYAVPMLMRTIVRWAGVSTTASTALPGPLNNVGRRRRRHAQ